MGAICYRQSFLPDKVLVGLQATSETRTITRRILPRNSRPEQDALIWARDLLL